MRYSILQIDHDHKTGIVRGVLCYRCNSVLGFVNDDQQLLVNLITYLKLAPTGINLLGLLNQLSSNGGV